MFIEKEFTREEIDHYLYLLAREYKRRNRKNKHVELILVGGASILLNYGFRDATTDIDAMILADSVMREAIYAVAEKEGLPDGWLNADFQRSDSYSSALIQNSAYYKTFANVLEVRTVRDEYLLAMKLVAGRNYKRDLSDIIGIIESCRNAGSDITIDKINNAMDSLYGGWDLVDEYARAVLYSALDNPDAWGIYEEVLKEEDENKDIRLENLKKIKK